MNFSENFFDWIGVNSILLQKFKFLHSIHVSDHIVELDDFMQQLVTRFFEQMLKENQLNDHFSNLKIGFNLLEILIEIDRSLKDSSDLVSSYQSVLLDNFQTLIEQNFKSKKLPKEYAELLYITPNHLNALCKDKLGISAGELIRSRVVLEAKRLLVNKEISVTEIAYLLNFQDASYFVKFFKKYTEFTPEQFRKQYYK